MIEAITQNLEKGIQLLENISDETYSNKTIPPYYASIGGHMRHVLDVFSCLINGLDTCKIDFSLRQRNQCAEQKTNLGISYCKQVIQQLKEIKEVDYTKKVIVTDNLGLGNVSATYTIAAVLMQTQSHAVHHFASIGYLIHQLGIALPKDSFGYNPTTPKCCSKKVEVK